VADRHLDYAREVADKLAAAGIRSEVDDRSESVGKKIRDGELRKAPFMLIVGDKEVESGQVSVRRHREGDIGAVSVGDFTQSAGQEIEERRVRAEPVR